MQGEASQNRRLSIQPAHNSSVWTEKQHFREKNELQMFAFVYVPVLLNIVGRREGGEALAARSSHAVREFSWAVWRCGPSSGHYRAKVCCTWDNYKRDKNVVKKKHEAARQRVFCVATVYFNHHMTECWAGTGGFNYTYQRHKDANVLHSSKTFSEHIFVAKSRC